jgi:Phage P22-like portal protein
MEVARIHQDQIPRIKSNVRRSYDYFKHNYDRFNEFRRFVFETSLKEEEMTLLMTLSKPQLEFNILEAYISRLLGEFSKQEPDIMVSADDENKADAMTIKLLEQHLRHTFSDSKNDHVRYEVYKDILSGGFSVLKITTDYANPMSFNQVINVNRVFDPTLCGFDQLARETHKGDGNFCFELFPMEKDLFIEAYPDVPVNTLTFTRDFSGFNWSYLNDATPIIMIADYYEKKKKKVKIVQLNDGRVVTQKKYDEMLENWQEFAAPPQIIGKPRTTEIDTIVRYRMIENRVLEYTETDFTHFPLVFVDGNSILVKLPKNGNVRQVTRPYVYHAKSAQRLKNFAGISLANEIENIVQHKFVIKKEALPKEEDFLAAIKDIQKPSNVIVNAFYEENPDQPIPEPIREIIRVPAPPEVLQGFQTTDGLIQQILGSYDASLGINNNQLSGIAIVEGATQSNAAAMPYVVGMLQALQRVAQIYVDLFPKYYNSPRTIPIKDEEGKRSYIKINSEDGVPMFYDSNSLNVLVKAGASFQVQKSRTIMMIKEIASMSPLFAQFMAEKGLPFILENMEGRGLDQLKEMVKSWIEEMQQQKQMQMAMQQQQLQNNPVQMKQEIEMHKLQQKGEEMNAKMQMDMAKLQHSIQETLADLEKNELNNSVEMFKTKANIFNNHTELALKKIDLAHRHAGAIAHHMKNSRKEFVQ